MYTDSCLGEHYKDMAEWNLNPRTGESMSTITDPFGNKIAANSFLSIPKDYYFANSRNYCCKLKQEQKIEPVNYLPKEAFFSNSRYYCCTGNAEANYGIAMANSFNNYAMAQANNFGMPYNTWRY